MRVDSKVSSAALLLLLAALLLLLTIRPTILREPYYSKGNLLLHNSSRGSRPMKAHVFHSSPCPYSFTSITLIAAKLLPFTSYCALSKGG